MSKDAPTTYLWNEPTELQERVRKLERALDHAAQHQDDCMRVQDPSGQASCTCAEIGRRQRQRIRELERAQAHVDLSKLLSLNQQADAIRRLRERLLFGGPIEAFNTRQEEHDAPRDQEPTEPVASKHYLLALTLLEQAHHHMALAALHEHNGRSPDDHE